MILFNYSNLKTTKTNRLLICLLIVLLPYMSICQQIQDPPSLEGRWNIDVEIFDRQLPAWLEVKKSGHSSLVGRIMFLVGSARPISKINFDDGNFSFSIPPQWDPCEDDIQFEGILHADSISGIVRYIEQKEYKWSGNRAPSLKRETVPEWGTPIKLFNGKDLQGWFANGENQWIVESGILKSPKPGSNLITDTKFTDFKLHIEFRYEKDSNSGIFLRGRYEVQISDSKGKEPDEIQFSSVYGLLPPNEMVAKDAGEWQSFDITLIGRRVTIIANGIPVIVDQVIPGITGGALDCYESEPGPLVLQGDHTPIEFQNIVLTPVKK